MTKIGAGLFLAALVLGSAARVSAETILTTDGPKTVVEDVAPLGAALSYVSGGDGLIGDGCWPAFCTGGSWTPSSAASNYDHVWLQYEPPIVWSASGPLSSVFAIPGVDHGPNPQENLEFIIWGSNDQTTWEEGRILAIYRDGFDTADTAQGHSDDYTSLWGFNAAYVYFRATSGDHLVIDHNFSLGEGEIDALAAPIPEPGTLFLLGTGLIGFARRGLRRRQ